MKNPTVCVLVVFCLVGVLFLQQTECISPVSTELLVKNNVFEGDHDLLVAEFRMEFDEDLYFQEGAPCAGGFCSALPTNDPCFPIACDFTLKGPDCGRAAAPECESICAAQRPSLCPEVQDWLVLEPDVESPLLSLSNLINDNIEIRFNWDKICQPMMIEVIQKTGESYVRLSATEAQFDLNAASLCAFTSLPETRVTLCPSHQRCYKYGTYFAILSTYRITGEASVIVRTLPIENITSPHVLPPADNPPSYYNPADPSVPVFLGVPFQFTFTGLNAFLPFALTTPYCGFLNVQAEVVNYDAAVAYEDLIVFASTNGPFPSSLITDYATLVKSQFAPFYVCNNDGNSNVTVWFSVVRSRSIGTNLPIIFTVDTMRPSLPRLPPRRLGGPDSWSQHVNFPPSPTWFAYSSGAVQLKCLTPASPTTPSALGCKIGCASFGCCRAAFPAFPDFPVPGSNNTLTLAPTPYALRSDPRLAIVPAPYEGTENVAARRFSFVLVLETVLAGSTTPGVLGFDWQQWLPTCTISSDLSSIGTADGRWLGSRVFFTSVPVSEPTCNYDEFVAVSEQLNALSEQLSVADSATETSVIRYQADQLTLSDAWLACFNYIDDTVFNASKSSRTVLATTNCPEFDATDPCCNSQLWNECCVPRSIDYMATVYTPNSTAIEGDCTNPICDEPLASTLAYNTEYVASRSCATSSDVGLRVAKTLTTHRTCLERYYGDDVEGITCYADSQCPTGQRCDVFANRCIAGQQAIADFYACLEDGLSSDVRIALISYNNWSIGLANGRTFQQLLDERYTTTDICMSVVTGHPYSPLRVAFPVTTNFPGCPPCSSVALDHSYIPPPWCGSRVVNGGSCSYIFESRMRNDFPSRCEQTDLVCNWNAAATTPAACTNPTPPPTGTASEFCGVCESEASCVAVPANSASECAAIGQVCVLADGTVDTTLSPDACANTFRCSESCGGGACTSAAQCQAQGQCVDGESIFFLLDMTYWAGSHSRQGFCAFPMLPYNTPDCSLLYSGSNPSSFGCVRFGVCVDSGGLGAVCTVDFDTQTSCTSAGGTWYPRPTNQAQCENPVLCSAPLLQGVGGLSLTRYNFLVDKDEQDCTECGGVRRPVNTWVPGSWNPGVMRPVTWTARALVAPYGFGPSIDVAQLVYDLNEAGTLSSRAQSLNNLQCTYNTLKRSALKITCDCLTDNPTDDCFDITSDGVIGQGSLCPATVSTAQAPPIFITTTPDDFDPSLTDSCVECTLTTTLLPAFDPEPIVSVTIAYARLREKANRGSYKSVQNENLAIVGQSIGDAVKITFDSPPRVARALRAFSICFTLSPYVQPRLDTYPVYDLGRPQPDLTVRPLGVDVTYFPATNLLCANVSYGRPGDAVSLIPIVRLDKYRDVPGPKLSDGQKACLIVIASFFSLAFVLLVVQSVRIVVAPGFDWTKATNLLWIFFAVLLLQRAIYMYLVAEEVLNLPNEHQLVDYFMMDFPMVCYMLANLVIALSFVFLQIQQKDPDVPKTYFWLSLSVCAFFVVMLFISTLLAYRYQVLNKPPISGPIICPTINDTTGKARTIRLIYESIILFVSLVIGLCVLIFGTKIWHQMGEVYGADRILVLAVVASIGIISDSVAFLVYYIVNDPDPYFSIVIFFTELLPICFIILQLSRSQIKQSSQSSGGSRRTGTGRSVVSASL